MRDGRQVKTCVGGTAGAGHDAGCVFQRLAGHDIAGADVLFDQPHHSLARCHAILVTALVGGRRARGIHQGKADRLGHTGHCVGGKLATTGTRRRTGNAFEDFKFRIRHIAGLMLADGFENILNRDVLAVQPARQDRTAVDKDRRCIQTDHRHHHTGQGFVTPRKTDNCIIAMATHRQFDCIGNRLARCERRPHALMTHRNAVGDGDRGKFAGGAVALLDTQFHGLRLTVQRDVAGRGLVPACRDTDPRLLNRFLVQTHRIEIGPVRRAGRAFGDVAAGQV